MLTELVTFPVLLLMVVLAVFPPKVTLVPLLPKFSLMPGRILTDFRNLQPITDSFLVSNLDTILQTISGLFMYS